MKPIPYQVLRADYFDVYVFGRLRTYAKVFALLVALVASFRLLPFTIECGCDALTFSLVVSAVSEGALLAGMICGSLLLLSLLSANAMARTLEKIGQETAVAWDGDHLHLRTRFGSDSYPWGLFEKWSETRRMLMLSLTRMHVFHLPKRDFSAEALQDLRVRIANAGVPRAKN